MELVNDQLTETEDMIELAVDNHFHRTNVLIFRSTPDGKMALYQRWDSEVNPHIVRWIPVPFLK